MWIRRTEFENLLGKYRKAVAEEQGRVEALQKMLDTVEDQLRDAHREIGHLQETIRQMKG